MKRYISGLVFSVVAATAAQAEVIVYDFTAMVNHTTVGYKDVMGTTYKGSFIKPGYVINGTFSIDLATPVSYSPTPTATGTYVSYEDPRIVWPPVSSPNYTTKNGASFAVLESGLTFQTGTGFNGSASIAVNDAPPGQGNDYVSIQASNFANGNESVNFFLWHQAGTLFSDAGLPKLLSLSDFGSATLRYSYSDPVSNQSLGLEAFVATLTARPASPVPEPSSYAMLALGLLTVGAAGYRQKRHRSDKFHA